MAVPATVPHVPESNQTALGLYVTPLEAYEMWRANPEEIHLLDVRTFEEYVLLGHLPEAFNVPYMFQKYNPPAFGATAPGPSAEDRPPDSVREPNPDFVSTVKGVFDPTDTILIYCTSGARAARAVDELAGAGFQHVYNIVHGLDGDKVDDPESLYHGKHMRNGWKNAGLPWEYGPHPETT